jgi:hypothetical protein
MAGKWQATKSDRNETMLRLASKVPTSPLNKNFYLFPLNIKETHIYYGKSNNTEEIFQCLFLFLQGYKSYKLGTQT